MFLFKGKMVGKINHELVPLKNKTIQNSHTFIISALLIKKASDNASLSDEILNKKHIKNPDNPINGSPMSKVADSGIG